MIRQTGLAQAIDIAENRAKYDECAKKLLSYKAIIAWILKSCTKELTRITLRPPQPRTTAHTTLTASPTSARANT